VLEIKWRKKKYHTLNDCIFITHERAMKNFVNGSVEGAGKGEVV